MPNRLAVTELAPATCFAILSAMSCCCERGIAAMFDRKEADGELRRYRREGPNDTTAALVDAVTKLGVSGAILLDVGGGVGAVYHALLGRGAARATHVDISAAYVDVAREEAASRGLADRVEHVVADFAAVADSVPSADVVTLDRVICCYPDMERLVTASARHARRVWGAVYPRDRWWVRASVTALNLWRRVLRDDFRAYVHSPAAIESLLRREGFARRTELRTFVWEVVVYARAEATET